ncbi:MAG: hypothetical protein H0V67_08870 [Geodermatophilaceae bacterium]|nr:hypothetical protein [Geodermatophilaceae bacterium]
MHRFGKRTTTILAASAIVLVGAGVAFAYWTAGGSGTGSAATGTSTPIVAVQTSVVTDMAPGDVAQPISGNFNNGNDGPVFVATVTASIATVVKAPGAPAGTCDASDYTLATPVATVNAEVPVGTGVGSWSGATIKFNNKPAVNQDACKGATVNLAYVIA